jgi:hypothetical protein
MGASFGTDVYAMEQISFSAMPLEVGGPQLPFSGVKEVMYGDTWDIDKSVIIRQECPLPCDVHFIEVWVEADDE